MAEQLELFGKDEVPTAGETLRAELPQREEKPEAPMNRSVSGNHEIPDGYVQARIGPDGDLRRRGSEISARLGLKTLAEQIEVVWNRKMRTAAGRAFYQTGRIELNPRLQALPAETRDGEIERTFLHELAHLVSFARAAGKRIQPHGPEWKQACADVGIPGEDRCHDLNFESRRQKRKYAYECPACGTVVKRVRRLQRRVACYDCCRSKAGGKFDGRFILEEKPIS